MPVMQGLRALYLDGGHPALGTVAKYTRSALDDLRGPTQVAALESLYTTIQLLAADLADDLADEIVTTAQLQALHNHLVAYKPLLGTPHRQTTTGATLRKAAMQHLAEAK